MSPEASAPTSRKETFEPSSDLAQGLRLYRTLMLARGAEEKIRQEYPKDEMKTPVHLGIGQEAIAVGVTHCLPPGARVFGTYRNHALYLALTQDVDGFFSELYGKVTGPAKGKAGSMHLSFPERGLVATSAVVGTTIPVAVGAALAYSVQGLPNLSVVFLGDGAVEEGVFWESLNFACLKKLKVLFVCEDNGLAIHTPSNQRIGFRSIPEAVWGFQCHVASGDGSDLVEVVDRTREMLNRMRIQPRPGFLHFSCYRFLEHVGPREDFDAGYRRQPTPEEMERLDPVCRFERILLGGGCSPDRLTSIRAEVEEQMDRSLRLAQQAPFPPASELTTDLFR